MFGNSSPQVVRKPMSFLGVAAFGLSAVLVTAVVCATGVALYGLRVVDTKADGLMSFVERTVENLPDIVEGLPPALADALDDVRDPAYRNQLRIRSKLDEHADRWGRSRASVEVENRGDRIVSLLSMRLVALDDDGDAIDEESVWAATPMQVEDEWRGPLLPGETRRFVVRGFYEKDAATIGHEITELRIWRGPTARADAPDRRGVDG